MPKLKYNPLFILWHVIKNDVHKLEYDAHSQWRYHIIMTRYWALNFPVIVTLFFFMPKLWIAIALFINTMYSIYANLATDFGAVPAAYTAMQADDIKATQIAANKTVPAIPDAAIIDSAPENEPEPSSVGQALTFDA